MATKKNTRKKSTRGRKSASRNRKNTKRQPARSTLGKSVIQNEIIGIITVFLGVFMLYSLFAKDSGMFGNGLHTIFAFLFGSVGTALIGLLCLVFGLMTAIKLRPFGDTDKIPAICFTVITLQIMAAFNIESNLLKYGAFTNQLFVSVYNVETKGGIIGIWIGGLYKTLLSEIGAYILIAAIIVLCIVVLFRNTILGYKENRRAIRSKEKEIKKEIKAERFNEKLQIREDRIREKARSKAERKNRKLLSRESEILSNPYDKKKEVVQEEIPVVEEKTSFFKSRKSGTGDVVKPSKSPRTWYKEKFATSPRISSYDEANESQDVANEQIKINSVNDMVENPDMEQVRAQVRNANSIDDIIKQTEADQAILNEELLMTEGMLAKSGIDLSKGNKGIERLDTSDIDLENEKQKADLEQLKQTLAEQEAEAQREEVEKIPYVYPDASLLKRNFKKNNKDEKKRVLENTRILESTLGEFNIGAKVTEVSIGPTVTRYEIVLEPGIKVSRVVNIQDNIAMALAANGIRMEAPIPGKNAIGIEVPNKENSLVGFRELVENKDFKGAKSKLAVALGQDITGNMVLMDLAKMPHLLIAGATGSGKSVCINTIINSILFHADPNEVRLILVDPKRVELAVYEDIPHLLVPVETNPNHAAGALKWAEKQMQMRYDTFAQHRVRNIEGYNKEMEKTGGEKMAQWVIIIDELADLMMVAKSQVESSICRLAQLARAAGIHLVLATQRPSVDVITGLIKANIPSRIAFAVTSQVDSRTILDSKGAENLLGNGDMLYAPTGSNSPLRAQGAFISDEEVENVVNFIKQTQKANYDESAIQGIEKVASEENAPSADPSVAKDDDFSDEKFAEALNIAFELGEISTSMLQRKLRIGYARAGRIVDELEQRGIISPPEGSKPRKVLKTRDDFFSNSVVMSDEVYPEGTLDIEDEIY